MQVRVSEVRLVGDNLKEISERVGKDIEAGIYSTRQVQEWADRMELDLVEISPKAKPPVCQIIDYKKFLYMRKKKEKDIKSKAVKTVVKEIRFGPNISDHDFDFKLKHAIKFLQEGSKVKSYVHFRGRTIVFRDRGELVLLRFLKELEDYGAPEALPKMEGRRMIVVVAPKKSAIKKKAQSLKNKRKEKEKPAKVKLAQEEAAKVKLAQEEVAKEKLAQEEVAKEKTDD